MATLQAAQQIRVQRAAGPLNILVSRACGTHRRIPTHMREVVMRRRSWDTPWAGESRAHCTRCCSGSTRRGMRQRVPCCCECKVTQGNSCCCCMSRRGAEDGKAAESAGAPADVAGAEAWVQTPNLGSAAHASISAPRCGDDRSRGSQVVTCMGPRLLLSATLAQVSTALQRDSAMTSPLTGGCHPIPQL